MVLIRFSALQIRQQNRELYSMRCDFVYKLRVAQDNRSEEALYFPHNVDFRGRAYTMHPHLNHLGADYCRGLLMFADSRPLGQRGLRWLRIQVRRSASPLFASLVLTRYAATDRQLVRRRC